MAWLQNLAGHAENLLNKIDQNAATVLSDGTNKLITGDIEQGQNFSEIQTFSSMKRSKSSNVSLNKIMSNSPIQDMFASEHSAERKGEAIFTANSDNEKSYNGSLVDEYFLDKSQKSSTSSSSSSIHNSFSVSQELDLLQSKLTKLEMENQDINRQLLNMQHLYSEMRNENSNLQFQLDRTNEQLTLAQQEKDQYVARAQRILQEKEKLIAVKDTNDIKDENILTTYNDELKNELEFHQQKVKDLTEKNAKLINDNQSLQIQHQVIQKGLQQSNQLLEESLSNEKRYRCIAEEDYAHKFKELHMRNQELLQTQELLRMKNEEIVQLRTALKQMGESTTNDEFENRIKSLTQTLMMKQNTLETITTERNALTLQLEKLEAEYRKTLAQMKRDQVKVIEVQDVNEERITIPHFLRVSPHDAGVTRRVKRAYSTLDSISLRTGIFLRRYPIARIFMLSYMVVLHVWVLIVLLWYLPSN
ncbi:golgin-84 isoform X2 [Cylas formicarius]|uniref:golgin-84 isoform X2 n=1 Tax=Cylas formicarius TaxID=197179 RepID=UPI002958DA24|nr:golgin-84 isoform X2 [Cylas formicarius]